MDVMGIRRSVAEYEQKYSYNFSNVNNTYTTATRNSTTGDITVTVKKTDRPAEPQNYLNGYFSFNTPSLEFGKKYTLTGTVDITSNPLDTMAIAVAPVGVNANRSNGTIKDGRICLRFTFIKKTNVNDKYLEFRCGGKSMVIHNLEIWND